MTSPKPSHKNKTGFTPNGETFRLLFANHPIPMWIYDLETLAFLDVNDAALEKYGYTRDEFLALTIKDIRPKEDVESLVKTLEQKRTPLNHSGEWHHLLKNGQVIDVEITTHALDFKGHKAALVMAQDITERKRVENALKESEKRFATIFRANPAAIAMTRFDDNQLVDVNAAWQRMTGYAHTEVVGHTPQELNLWVNLEQRDRLIEMVGEHGKAHGEMQLRQKSGEIRDMLMSADLIELNGKRYLLTMTQDITESKRAAEKLHESESLLAKAQRIGKLGHAEWVPDRDELVCSNEMLRIFEFPFDSRAISRSEVGKKVHPEDRKRLAEMDRKLFAEHADLDYEYRILLSDDKEHWVHQQAKMSYNENGAPIRMIGVFQDITERKLAEEKLTESLSLLRIAEESAKLGGWSVDLEKNLVTWSDQVAAIHEAPAKFLLPLEEGISFYAPEWRERITKVFTDCSQQGIPYNEELEIITAKGNRVWVQAAGEAVRNNEGKIIKVQGSFQNIDERKQAKENLIASEIRYRRLFEAAKDGILILEAETGVIVDVNPFLCKMLGFSHEELCGKELWEIGFFKDITESKANFLELQEKGYIRYDDLPLEIANGRKLHVEFVSNVYNVNHHKVIQCNIRDITERKQAEVKLAQYSEHLEEMVEARTMELRETQEKLVRNEKLAVLGQLAGGLGHELRNPLAVINNALYYLKLVGTNGNEKVKEYLGIIQAETRTAEKIISDLLDFARIKSVDREPVSACELVDRTLKRFPVHPSVQVTLEIPEELPKVYVDPRQMEQVLGNLVINACQAMSAGGELTISARQEEEMITIAVQDNGVGIPPENMKKIFEPLFTTKARGIGLGLAVSQKLAEANGGRIEVQSEAGKDSTFTVYLPAHMES